MDVARSQFREVKLSQKFELLEREVDGIPGVLQDLSGPRRIGLPNFLQSDYGTVPPDAIAIVGVLMSSASAFNLSYHFDRFNMAASQIFGKRLTWNEVTGKNHEPQNAPELSMNGSGRIAENERR
jgi:hypothetical protein